MYPEIVFALVYTFYLSEICLLYLTAAKYYMLEWIFHHSRVEITITDSKIRSTGYTLCEKIKCCNKVNHHFKVGGEYS